MNIKTLNEIASIIKQRSDNLFDVPEWNVFVRSRFITPKWGDGIVEETVVSFIQENESRNVCHIATAIAQGNAWLEDGITITKIIRDGNPDYYEEISETSGVNRNVLTLALHANS